MTDRNLLRAQLLIEAADLLDEAHIQDDDGKFHRVNTNSRVSYAKNIGKYVSSGDLKKDLKRALENSYVTDSDKEGIKSMVDDYDDMVSSAPKPGTRAYNSNVSDFHKERSRGRVSARKLDNPKRTMDLAFKYAKIYH